VGQKETRYLQSLADAESLYEHVMAQKMGDEKGYKHVDLVSVSPKIGSDKVRLCPMHVACSLLGIADSSNANAHCTRHTER
jgi:hypothetical protein